MTTEVTASRDEILAAVAARQADTEELLIELVAAPTVLGDELPGQLVMRNAFEALGLPTQMQPLDATALAEHPLASPFSWDVSGKANIVADWDPPPGSERGGRSLILNGHIDVVAPGPADMWASPPFAPRRDGDWLYGRGAGDMKCGLAAYIGAVAGLRALGLAPLAPVQLQSVVEEEGTGNGAVQCVIAGRPADAVVVTEPTSLMIQRSQVGVLWFQVVVRGRPAHAGDAPIGGTPIEALTPGILRGGDWSSPAAPEAILHCRLALFPGEPVADLRARIEQTIAQAATELDGFGLAGRSDGFV